VEMNALAPGKASGIKNVMENVSITQPLVMDNVEIECSSVHKTMKETNMMNMIITMILITTLTPVFGMMVPTFSVEITVKRKTRLVMEFAAMAGFHVEKSRLSLLCLSAHHNASRMTASMNTTEIVMANAFMIESHVMVSVQKAIDSAMIAAQAICVHATIPVLKAGKGVGVTNA